MDCARGMTLFLLMVTPMGSWDTTKISEADIERKPTKRGDQVATPHWTAKDMIDHWIPQGTVLDPCRGTGVFTDLLMNCSSVDIHWCEIDEGKDFFDWKDPVDWVIGNPPYSKTRLWFRHSYTIAQHLLYLVPIRNIFSGYGFIKEIDDFGGIQEIRVYGTGSRLGFPMGNAIGAFHIEKDYFGPTKIQLYDNDG